jgi:hypothetical protein
MHLVQNQSSGDLDMLPDCTRQSKPRFEDLGGLLVAPDNTLKAGKHTAVCYILQSSPINTATL